MQPSMSLVTHYEFSDTALKQVSYEDTAHFRVTRDFLNHYQKRVSQILGE